MNSTQKRLTTNYFDQAANLLLKGEKAGNIDIDQMPLWVKEMKEPDEFYLK